MQRNLLAILVLFLIPVLAISQRTITGSITDAETGEGLIGASILVVGTSTGTVTDFDGNYSLNLPEGGEQITVSYTGYSPQTITIGASNILDVQLKSGTVLDEVVVIGYGTVKREDATGSVQSVTTKDFNKGAITSTQQLLSGKVAGVQITTDGDPGGGSTIRIRGGSSLSASNDPLIVIDGIPVAPGGISGGRNPLNIVNPNDIESISILKDASATAIYGSRASNGVILITTKKGKLGKKIGVNYTGSVGVSQRINKVDMLNASEYRALIQERFPDPMSDAQLALGDANTDWQDEIYQNALFHDHNLSLSGALDIIPYRLSLGYTDQEGILKRDEFQRSTIGLNLSPGFLDNRLQVNVNLKGTFTDNHFANRGAIGNAVRMDPTQPVRIEDQTYGGYYTWLQANGNGNPNGLAPSNPIALLEQRDDASSVNRYIANAQIDYRFGLLPELRANLNLGYDRFYGEGTVEVPDSAAFSFDAVNGGGEMNRYSQTRINELLEFYLNYVKEIDQHKIDVMGGYSWQHFEDESDFFNSNVAGTITTEGEDSGELYLLSLFGRVNYTLQDKYLFTFTLRGDATSRFSPDTRWGLFPAAAFAYKILDGNDGFVNNLKLRLGYGITGQQDVGGFYISQARYLSSNETAQYPFGGTPYITIRPEGYDANIKWEETTTYNAGIDFGFWNERVYGSIDYYFRETRDLINFIPVPAGTNFANAIVTNVGDLENKGIEFAANIIPVKTEDLFWDFGFNVSANTNKITKLTLSDDPNYQGVPVGGISGGVGNTIQIHSVGFPANSFYVYEQVYNEDGSPIEGEYVDQNNDGSISTEDLVRKENPAPNVFIGFTSLISYKNFEFSFAGRSNIGNYVYNDVLGERAVYLDLFHPTEYLSNVHNKVFESNFEERQSFSDYYLQNASFLRLDHVTLGYNFKDIMDNKIQLKVYATVQNPLLVTGYDGLDPEVNGGIDGNIYPRSRTFLLGVNFNY